VNHVISYEKIRDLTSNVLNFFGDKPHIENSYAEKIIEILRENPENPLGIVLQYPQNLLINAADHLRLLNESRLLFTNSSPQQSLPIVSYLSLIRVAIENSVIAHWLVSGENIKNLLTNGIAAQFQELDGYRSMLDHRHVVVCCKNTEIGFNDHPLPEWNSLYEEYFQKCEKLKTYALSTRNNFSKPPSLMYRDANKKGMLFEFMGEPLESLYSQLSGVIHGSNWGFSVNTIRIESPELDIDQVVSTVSHSANPQLQAHAIAVAVGSLEIAFFAYTRLFTVEKNSETLNFNF
jgi:hypothetical protein